MRRIFLLLFYFFLPFVLHFSVGSALIADQSFISGKTFENKELVSTHNFQQEIAGFPWLEDFEQLTPGWLVFNLEGEGATWSVSSLENHTPWGEFSAYHNWATGFQDGWLVSPLISFPDEQMQLRFWSYNIFAEFYGKNSVLISTASPDPLDQDYVEVWTTSSVTQTWEETIIDLTEYQNQQIYIAFRYEGDFAHGWFLDDVLITPVPEQITVDLKFILEGAFMPDQDILMHTLLNDNNLLPHLQPFSPALPYFGNPSPLWYHQGGEATANIAENIVDWVLIELRDAPSAEQADITTVIARKAVFLLNNGFIEDIDGSPVTFDVLINHGLYAVIYHRNHIPVMSSGHLNVAGQTFFWDFTPGPDLSFGQGQKPLGGNLYGLFGGDGDGNGQIQTQDKNNVWEPLAGTGFLYLPADFNLNGQVQTQDLNEIWDPNTGLGTQVPGLVKISIAGRQDPFD